MDITNEMLQAAVGKAIEAGLLPRNAWRDDADGNKELIRLVLQAALALQPKQGPLVRPYVTHPELPRFSMDTNRSAYVYSTGIR